jgi:hypothetical protein
LARQSDAGSPGIFVPGDDAGRYLVREELEQLLASPQFRNSRRYPAFLRYVVEQTLSGQGGLIKERSIGIALFERPADYDTSNDHIVRTTAAEIRKRIAQYYREPEGEPRIRIDLPPGSYVPEFRLASNGAATTHAPEPVTPPIPRGSKIDRRTALLAGAAVLLLALVATAAFWRVDSSEGAPQRFWAPVLNSPGEVTICVSSPVPPESPQPAVTARGLNFLQLHTSEEEHISVGDAEALAHLAAFLGGAHKTFQVRRPPISLADLRQGPVILIGAFNNEWTIRLTGDLRFRFEHDPRPDSSLYWIADRLHPENRDWSFDYGKPADTATQDFALISRVPDPNTGRELITAAGIAKYGTVAAGEFLTNPGLLAEFDRRAPKGWTRKNVQIVIRTTVINDNSGPPEIVAEAVW